MIIYIDKFNGELDLLKKNIKNYEYAIYEDLSTIKNMYFDWKDGYTESFFQKIKGGIQDVDEFINSLNKLISTLNNTTTRYLTLRNGYIRQIGYTSIINQNNYVVNENDEDEKKQLKQKILREIYNIENDTASRLSKNVVLTCRKANYENLTLSKEKSDFIGMQDNMVNAIKKLSLQNENVKKKADLLKESFAAIMPLYTSNNSNKIKQLYNDTCNSLNIINSNLNSTYNYIKGRQDKYKKGIQAMVDSVKQIDIDK